MNYILSTGKYLRVYKRWKRKSYMNSFEKAVLKYVSDKPFIRVKQSACKRYYVDYDKCIVFRMDYKTSYGMGCSNYNKTLEEAMKYYRDKKWYIIVVDLYVSLTNPRMNIHPMDDCYLICLENDYKDNKKKGS